MTQHKLQTYLNSWWNSKKIENQTSVLLGAEFAKHGLHFNQSQFSFLVFSVDTSNLSVQSSVSKCARYRQFKPLICYPSFVLYLLASASYQTKTCLSTFIFFILYTVAKYTSDCTMPFRTLSFSQYFSADRFKNPCLVLHINRALISTLYVLSCQFPYQMNALFAYIIMCCTAFLLLNLVSRFFNVSIIVCCFTSLNSLFVSYYICCISVRSDSPFDSRPPAFASFAFKLSVRLMPGSNVELYMCRI